MSARDALGSLGVIGVRVLIKHANHLVTKETSPAAEVPVVEEPAAPVVTAVTLWVITLRGREGRGHHGR